MADVIEHSDSLFEAIRKTKTEEEFINKLTQFLSTPGAVNLQNDDGHTVLMLAAMGGYGSALKQLIHYQPDLAITDPGGRTILHFCLINTEDKSESNETLINLLTPILGSPGVDVNARDNEGRTVLMLAAMRGFSGPLHLILQHKPDVNTTDNLGGTALHYAFYGDKDNEMKSEDIVVTILGPILSSPGVNVNIQDNKGHTVLMLATMLGYAEALELILQYTTDLTAADKYGNTALHLSMFNLENMPRKSEVETMNLLELLLSCPGVDINVQNSAGETLLMEAASTGSLEIWQLVLHHKPNVDATDINGNTAMYHMFTGSCRSEELIIALIEPLLIEDIQIYHVKVMFMMAAQLGYIQALQLILQSYPSLSTASDANGDTALHCVFKNINSEIKTEERVMSLLMLLLSSPGFDINTQNNQGQTIAMLATIAGMSKALKLIVNHEPNLRLSDHYGNTTLHNIFYYEEGYKTDDDVIDLLTPLLSSGIDVNMRDNKGATVLMLAAAFGHVRTCQYILQHQPEFTVHDADGDTVLHYAFIDQDGVLKPELEVLPILELLLSSASGNIDMANGNGDTVLMWASMSAYTQVLQLILKYKPNLKLFNKHGNTVLYNAFWNVRDQLKLEKQVLTILEMLLSVSCDVVNLQDKRGRTVGMYAAMAGYLEAIKLLTLYQPDLNIPDEDGNTALHYVFVNKDGIRSEETIINLLNSLLVSSSVDVDVQNNDGLTVLMKAAQSGLNEVLQFILGFSPELGVTAADGKTVLDNYMFFLRENQKKNYPC